MQHQPPTSSIWGDVITSIEIAPNIYIVVAKDYDSIEHMGIMAQKSTAHSQLSYKAISIAQDHNNWLHFDDNNKFIPLYEILNRRMALCKQLEYTIQKKIAEITCDGKLSLTNYFGEYTAPTHSPQGIISNVHKIYNGLYFTKDSDSIKFAVHEAISDNFMSPLATEFGCKNGNYLFYDTTTCAIPLNELKNVFCKANDIIIYQDSLYATLNQLFSTYTTLYNKIVQDEYRIPTIKAPINQFIDIHFMQ